VQPARLPLVHARHERAQRFRERRQHAQVQQQLNPRIRGHSNHSGLSRAQLKYASKHAEIKTQANSTPLIAFLPSAGRTTRPAAQRSQQTQTPPTTSKNRPCQNSPKKPLRRSRLSVPSLTTIIAASKSGVRQKPPGPHQNPVKMATPPP